MATASKKKEKALVIVESPAKSKTIKKFSATHIRLKQATDMYVICLQKILQPKTWALM